MREEESSKEELRGRVREGTKGERERGRGRVRVMCPRPRLTYMQRGRGGRAARRRWHSKPCVSQPSHLCVCEHHLTVRVCACEDLCVFYCSVLVTPDG